MFCEVAMVEITEVLRLWLADPKKRIAAQLGLDPKTVRRYVQMADETGLGPGTTLTDDHLRAVLLALHPSGGRPRGDTWARCVEERTAVEKGLRDGLRLSKIRKLLIRKGVEIPHPTLHRVAALELRFGQTGAKHLNSRDSVLMMIFALAYDRSGIHVWLADLHSAGFV